MATEKSTRQSSESSEVPEPGRQLPDLELPEDPEFRSFPPLLPMDEFIKRNRQVRELFPDGFTPEERWAARTDEIFEF